MSQLRHFDREELIWDSTLGPNKKLVLLCLNSFLGSGGEGCWPSQETMAAMTGLHARTVIRVLSSLKKDGIVLVERRYKSNGERTSNFYRIAFEALKSLQKSPSDSAPPSNPLDDSETSSPSDSLSSSPSDSLSQDLSNPDLPISEQEPPNPQQAGGTIAPQSPKVETSLSSQEGIEAKTPQLDPEPKLRRRAAAPKKPAPGDRFCQDGMTDKQRQSRVIALRKDCFSREEEVFDLVGAELTGRIQRNWAWYKTHCAELPEAAGIGDKTSAAIALVILWETDFLGYGVDGFRKGCNLFAAKQAGKKGSGVPACSRFLIGKSGEQPSWVQELVKAEPTANVSDPAGDVVQRPDFDQEEVSRRLVEQARREIDQQFSNQQGAA